MGDRNLVFVSNLCLKSLSLVFVSGGAEGCGGDDAEGTGDFWGGHRQRLGVSPGKVRTIARNCGVTSGDRALVPPGARDYSMATCRSRWPRHRAARAASLCTCPRIGAVSADRPPRRETARDGTPSRAVSRRPRGARGESMTPPGGVRGRAPAFAFASVPHLSAPWPTSSGHPWHSRAVSRDLPTGSEPGPVMPFAAPSGTRLASCARRTSPLPPDPWRRSTCARPASWWRSPSCAR